MRGGWKGGEGWIFILEESQSLEDNQTRIHKRWRARFSAMGPKGGDREESGAGIEGRQTFGSRSISSTPVPALLSFLLSFLPSSCVPYFHSSKISYCNRCFSPFIVVTWAFLPSKRKVDRLLLSIYMVSVRVVGIYIGNYCKFFENYLKVFDKFVITSKNSLLMVTFARIHFHHLRIG